MYVRMYIHTFVMCVQYVHMLYVQCMCMCVCCMCILVCVCVCMYISMYIIRHDLSTSDLG